MKTITLLLAAAGLLAACQAAPTAAPAPSQPPSLLQRFGGQTLLLESLLVQGQPVAVPSDLQASIAFGSDGRATGSGGCNRYFSDYTAVQPGQVAFNGLGSTKMYCQDKMDVESGLFQVLQQAARYQVEGARLVIQSADGQYRAVFYEPPMK